jgi:(S)-citramalyl-CoA lyase
MSARRCLLFVPGNRPERFEKAIASGADMICIDLEDATPIAEKASARAAALTFIAQHAADCELILRINPITTAFGLQDVLAIAECEHAPKLVMVPKVERADELRVALSVLQHRKIEWIALLESALGVENAYAIAALPGLSALMFGGADFSAQLGAAMSEAALAYARARIAAAAASQALLAIDVPHLETHNSATLLSETQLVKAMGFQCKSAIHPTQVNVIQSALMPTAEEIAHARALLEAFNSAPHAAIAYQGKLIDRPVVLAAEAVIRRAGLKID